MKNNVLRNTIVLGVLCAALIITLFLLNKDESPEFTKNDNLISNKTDKGVEDKPGTAQSETEERFETGGNYNEEGKEESRSETDVESGMDEPGTGIIKPELAKKIIKETADKAIDAISRKDAKTISDLVHPVKGVRFTPYTYVSLEKDVVFKKGEIINFFEDKEAYLWGHYDGSGEEIYLTPSEYYERFVYSEDFKNAEKIGYNEVLSSGNMLENQFEVYDNPIVVEYYFSGFNPEYEGMDWKSLRLVFEKYEGNWYLVGIIHNQWTI
ncbi:MAG: hypothetical protein GX066_08465 [Clostridiaceae bacterium]|nr:hypothetical protein [Clostridiaceae bacterium]